MTNLHAVKNVTAIVSSGKGGRFEEFGRGRGEGRFGDRGNDRFGARKPFAGRPFKEELGGRSGPRAKVVDKRRFSGSSRVCAERNGSSGFGCGSLLQVV